MVEWRCEIALKVSSLIQQQTKAPGVSVKHRRSNTFLIPQALQVLFEEQYFTLKPNYAWEKSHVPGA